MAARLLTQQVVGTSFAFYTDDEIRRISVKRVTNPQTFDAFNHPAAE
jgi:DNA-directed RNA polymerase beta' subunit